MTAARAGKKVIRTEEQVRATSFFFSTLDFAPYLAPSLAPPRLIQLA